MHGVSAASRATPYLHGLAPQLVLPPLAGCQELLHRRTHQHHGLPLAPIPRRPHPPWGAQVQQQVHALHSWLRLLRHHTHTHTTVHLIPMTGDNSGRHPPGYLFASCSLSNDTLSVR